MEEEKVQFHSETSSILSGKKSTSSSIQKRLTKAEKLAKKFAGKYNIDDQQDI